MGRLRKMSTVMIAALAGAACGFAQTSPATARTQKPAPAEEQRGTAYNPLRAQHDLEVGKFYQNRGDLDGAISRYKDALRYKPNFSEPCLLLGEAYEQKHDFGTAISYYQQYIKMVPNTSESKKLGKRIAELQKKMKKNAAGLE